MDLHLLQNFLTVIEQKSISNAASLIRIAQPALSRQMRILEEQLGSPLLVRHRWGIAPTPAGELLVEHARDIVHRMKGAQDAIAAATQAPGGTLAIGVTVSVAAVLIPPLVIAAQHAMPQVKFRLGEQGSEVLHQRLLAREIDLAIVNLRGVPSPTQVEPLLTEPIVLAGPAGMFRQDEPMTLRQAMRHRSIVTAPSGRLRLIYEEAVAEAGASGAFVEVDSFPALLALLTLGSGFSLLPYSTISAQVQSGTISWTSVAPRPLTRRLALASAKGAMKTPATARAIELVRAIVQERADSYRWTPAPARRALAAA